MAADPHEKFVRWLAQQAVDAARGTHDHLSDVDPAGRYWLGRLAPESEVLNHRLGDRGERLDPCSVGIQVIPGDFEGAVRLRGTARVWRQRTEGDGWEKLPAVTVEHSVRLEEFRDATTRFARDAFETAFRDIGAPGLAAEFSAEMDVVDDQRAIVLQLINTSATDEEAEVASTLFETELQLEAPGMVPFDLDTLPDGFRYPRTTPAYGLNAGVAFEEPATFRTTDTVQSEQVRPRFWDDDTLPEPVDVGFERLADNPQPVVSELAESLVQWGHQYWSETRLRERSREENWSDEMLHRALQERQSFLDEAERLREAADQLGHDPHLERSFSLANRAFAIAPAISHAAWRPFQLGFVASVLADLDDSRDVVETLWFPTGGGKTEAYLLLAITVAFYDRLRGKHEGISCWARFPLRMLSLQQSQRFADIVGAAELVRREAGIAGDPFTLGFYVGRDGTPNDLRPNPDSGPDPADPDMPAQYQVLLHCPYCGSAEVGMTFDAERWSLAHVCAAAECPSTGESLGLVIVDREIYRMLPTVVIGTLDKAANLGMQAAMRGFFSAPYGKCPVAGHGFTYAPRSASRSGCLFPGCTSTPDPLQQAGGLYPPTLRLQDELHLLRDSLGAVDSHYEALLDSLSEASGVRTKIVASSATLSGQERQVEALYRRSSRVFPVQGPEAGRSFWSVSSEELARLFVGVAPRGVTLEYASDQLNESLQRAVRYAVESPGELAAALEIDEAAVEELVSIYGTQVVYGSTLKDVEAAARSFESQIRIDRVNAAVLTGRTPLREVHETIDRLESPEDDFYQRIHLIAASSMLSHGVDIDRLNVMSVIGLPLSTAEFIQTTSRVGRTYPGLVIVLHKVARERDYKVFRLFDLFVQHGGRLVEPIPITAKSRRVLELTLPGIIMGILYGLHEPASLDQGTGTLTTQRRLRAAYQSLPVTDDALVSLITEALQIDGPLDERLRRDVTEYVREFLRALNDPGSAHGFVSDLLPGRPMLSLRDVERQTPVFSRTRGRR